MKGTKEIPKGKPAAKAKPSAKSKAKAEDTATAGKKQKLTPYGEARKKYIEEYLPRNNLSYFILLILTQILYFQLQIH